MLYIDLDELPTIFNKQWLWSTKHPAPAWFKREDYLFNKEPNLKQELLNIIAKNSGIKPNGPIRILTQPRAFGYCFNPLTLYYCYDKSGHEIECIVAEVRNTPWGERHCYILKDNLNKKSTSKLHYVNTKEFHVSPFMPMDIEYRWSLVKPAKKLITHIENYTKSTKIFDATLTMRHLEINDASLKYIVKKYPFISYKTVFNIYMQALKLKMKKVPFIPHPNT